MRMLHGRTPARRGRAQFKALLRLGFDAIAASVRNRLGAVARTTA
jgi:hypothetical protein